MHAVQFSTRKVFCPYRKNHYLVMSETHTPLDGTILALPHVSKTWEEQTREAVEEINARRRDLGLPPLVHKQRSMTAAQMAFALKQKNAWYEKDEQGNDIDDWRAPIWTRRGAYLWDSTKQVYELLP